MEYIAIKKKGIHAFLNFASKRKELFGKGYRYFTSSSPYPTFRPIDDMSLLKSWINKTSVPKSYEIISIYIE